MADSLGELVTIHRVDLVQQRLRIGGVAFAVLVAAAVATAPWLAAGTWS